MLPVKHLAPKILIADNNCGRQLDRRSGWVAQAYYKKVGASIAYDRRPDASNLVQVGTLNLGSQDGKGGDVCK